MRVADLLRIYTGGTGVLPTGAIHPDLVKRLAAEAARSADHVLQMCIRALDYLPPIDVTFFEYLRALITADYDFAGDDDEYRVAFVEAFRRRGIYPQNMGAALDDTPRTLSVDTLRWKGGINLSAFKDEARAAIIDRYSRIIEDLREYAKEVLYIQDRKRLFDRTRSRRAELHAKLKEAFKAVPEFAEQLGLNFGGTFDPADDRFEVHSLRSSIRVTPAGRFIPQVVVVLTQAKEIDAAAAGGGRLPRFRGGSTLVVDLTSDEPIRYRITKNIASATREETTTAFVRAAMADPLRALLVAPEGDEHFLALHSLADDGV